MNSKTQKQILGKLGEDIACKYLIKNGFSIIDRNYLKRCGEIDIIAKNNDIIHFVEVKSVSRACSTNHTDNLNGEINREIVSSETGYRPEDNLHPWKLQRLSKTIQIYLLENNVSDETNWQFDIITVCIDEKSLISKVFMLENVIL